MAQYITRKDERMECIVLSLDVETMKVIEIPFVTNVLLKESEVITAYNKAHRIPAVAVKPDSYKIVKEYRRMSMETWLKYSEPFENKYAKSEETA